MLIFEGVTLARGLRVLVQGASFHLPAGAFWTLQGANGAGKTTLLQAAAQLAEPLYGTICRETSLAYLSHELALKEVLPVAHYISAVHAEAWELQPLGDLPISALSAGQKKRVALARTLAVEAPLWLLDEPLANLDPAYEALALSLMRAHCLSGGAVLATTHKALACDLRLILKSGRVEAYDD